MIERVLEPELMDDPEESEAYDDMDHGGVNAQFVTDLLEFGDLPDHVLDVGTGTARIPIELCSRVSQTAVLACDAAVSMLEHAKIVIAAEGYEGRIELRLQDAKALEFDDETFPCVISNSLVHHIAEPFAVLSEMVRVAEPDATVFVRDLARPDRHETVENLVESYSGEESEYCQQLFRQSLIAALTLEEVREMVARLGFSKDTVTMTSDRHWTWQARKSV
ncbi:MAG: class I SAM-dependent methyltransferase [Aureliella sp.]